MPPSIIYLARGRPQRPRANLVQTLHTVEALQLAGARVRLYVPPLPRGFDMPGFLEGMGIREAIDIRGCALLHSNFNGWPFMLLKRATLTKADAVYTRVPAFSQLMSACGIAHVLEVHDTAELLATDLDWLKAAARKRVLRGLVAISFAGRDALVAAGLDAAPIEVLHSGVDLSAYGTLPLPDEDDFRIPHGLYIGRISKDRGLGILEHVARAGYAVTLAGPADDAPAPQPTLDVRAAVPHARVPELLALGNVALMPYQADLRHAATISPIKLFEAMAAGRLVVASDLPTLREIIRPGENGLLIPPDKPEAWVDAMALIQRDPAAAARMAAQGRHDAAAYAWDARARKLLTFLESLSQ